VAAEELAEAERKASKRAKVKAMPKSSEDGTTPKRNQADRQNAEKLAQANQKAADAARDARAAIQKAENATKAQQASELRIQQLEAKLLQLERPTPASKEIRQAARASASRAANNSRFLANSRSRSKEGGRRRRSRSRSRSTGVERKAHRPASCNLL
jgi:colicin import membrane protein